MSGQSSHLSLKEAKAMQQRVQAGGSHAHNHGGGSGKKAPQGKMGHEKMKKEKMSEEC